MMTEVPKWIEYLWNVRKERSNMIKAAVSKFTEALPVKSREMEKGFSPHLFAHLYDEQAFPEEADGLQNKLQRICVEASEEFEVSGDPDFSALASVEILNLLSEALPELIEEEEDEQQQDSQEGAQKGAQGAQEGAQQPSSKLEETLKEKLQGLALSFNEAKSKTQEGMRVAVPGSQFIPSAAEQGNPERMKLAEVLQRNPKFLKIMEMAGRIQRASRARKPAKTTRVGENMKGVTVGGDLTKILPSELVGLKSSKLRTLTLSKILEKRALQYEQDGKEPLKKGPIVLLLDESGSMGMGVYGGRPHDWARAIGVSVQAMARKSKRECIIAGFNGNIRDIHVMSAKGSCSVSRRGFIDRQTRIEMIGSIVNTAPAGGTSFDLAMSWGVKRLTGTKSDLIFVTDGQGSIKSETLKALNQLKESEGATVYGFTINGGSTSHALQQICDELVDLDQSQDKAQAAGVLKL